MSSRVRSLAARWAPPALLALAVALPLLPALPADRTVFYRDLGLAPGPILEEAFSQGEWLPLWTSGLGEGRPLLANPGNSLLAPLSLLYRLLPFELAFELFLLLHLVVAALGMRALARELGAGAPAAWTAGAAFGLGGVMVSATNLAPTLAASAFAPWVALAGLRAVEAPSLRRIAGLALALAACALGGQPEPVVLTILASSAWALVATDAPWPLRLKRSVFAWGAGGLWSLAIAAPQVFVAALHARISLRAFGFTTDGLLYNSLDPARLPAFLLPRWGGHPLERLSGGFPHAGLTDSGTPYLVSLYLGLVVVLLAATSFSRGGESKLDRLRFALGLTALAGAVLVLGRHLPGARALVEAVPALVPFRYPVKLAFLAQLALPLLAAAGVDRLLRRAPESRRPRLALLLPGLVALDLLAAHASFFPTVVKDEAWSPTPLAAELHERAEEIGVPEGQWRVYLHRLPQGWGPRLPEGSATEAELYRRQRRLLTAAMGLPQGLRYCFDPSHDLLDPVEEFELARAAHAEPGEPQWRAVGAASGLFVISPKPDLAGESLELLGGVGPSHGLEPGDAWLYRNRAFLPRARLESGAAAAISDESHRSLVVRATGPGRLEISDTLTPGWSASVGGELVELQRSGGAFRAVELPPGEQEVVMSYRPPGLLPGALLALAGLAAAAVALLRRTGS